MLRNILLAHDFSSPSDRALAYGVDLVRRTEATPHLVYVREVPLGPLVRGDPSPVHCTQLDALQGQFEERCRPLLDALGRKDNSVCCHVEQSGSVAPALVEFAEREGVDLIVMGTHGRRGMEHVLHGTVAEEVLRRAPCPVLMARDVDEEEEGGGAPSVERIVVPVAFTVPTRGVLQYAGRLASLHDVPIKLVHVVEFPTGPHLYEAGSPLVASRAGKSRAERALQKWSRGLRGEGHAVSYVVHRGAPVPIILDAAPSSGDMLVMATRGLSGLKRTVLGSVTEEVIRRAPGPVITARSIPEGP